MALHAYLPQDRLRALARGEALPAQCQGTALFADISGFTALTEALTQGAGQRRGVEQLAQRINAVHQALIEEVEGCGGSVVGFAGDGMTCWFDAGSGPAAQAAALALHCARRMQQAMGRFAGLSVKVGLARGEAQRLVVGDPALHLIDLLAGPAVAAAVAAEGRAAAGEVVFDGLDADALRALGEPAAPPAQAARPRVDPEILRPWLLPFVFARESSGGGLFATDLRPATALFLRLLAGPAGLAAVPAQVAQAQRLLQQHGGVLLEVTVDGAGICLYGNFGAAQVHEDDAARALRAALALHEALQGTAGAVQIGLSCGTLCVGGYGGSTRRSFGAIGDEVNSAARLMAKAQPGETLLSGRVRQSAGPGFAFEARPPMPMKGKAEPMPVFALAGLQQHRALRLQEPEALLPMVGREAEKALLAARLAEVRDGRGDTRARMLRVVAEAGMGKSRLLAEAIRQARRAGFIGYGGACRLDGVQSSYRVWTGIWTAFFDLDPTLPQRRQRQAVQAALALHAPEHAEAWPLLGAVLAQDWPDNAFTAALQPAGRKALLESLLLACLESAAREAATDGMGLLLVLEDLHAADPLSIDLLLRLLHGVQALPVLWLSAERPEERSGSTPLQRLNALPQVELIELAGIAPADVEHIVRAKLALQFPERAGAVPAELIERVAARAQGNPFYVEELLDYLHDRGIDPRRPDAVAALELPSSLHALVLSRIDRLPLSQQRTLKAASIIGREFTLHELQAYCPALGSLAEVQADLQALAQLGFTPQRAAGAAAGLADGAAPPGHVFKHLVTLEVSYQTIAHDSRVQLHEQYARHLEQIHAEALPAWAPQLAHHYECAGCNGPAARYLRLAGEQAAAAFDNTQAIDCFDRALAHWPADDLAARFELLMRRQAVHDLQGRHDRQRADLDALRQLAPRLGQGPLPGVRVATVAARLDIVVGHYAAAQAGAEAALAALATLSAEPLTGAAAELQVDALSLQAQALYFAGQADAGRPALEQALVLARACGYVRGEISALSHTGLLNLHAGDSGSAEHWLQQALQLSQAHDQLRLQLDVLNNLGMVAKSRGRLAQAMAHYEQAQRIARRIGDRSGEAVLLLNLGSLALARGDFHAAGQHCDQAAAMFSQANEPVQHALALVNRAEAHRETGQYAAAQAGATQALALLRSSGFRRGEAVVLENLGLIAFARGDLASARQHVDAALALARTIGLRGLQATASLQLGRVQMAGGEWAAAARTLDEAAGLAGELGAELLGLEVQVVQAQLLLNQAEGAAAAGATARRLLPRLEPLLARLLPASADAAADTAAAPELLPMALYLAAWQVLAAAGDERAAPLLARARAELAQRGQRLPDAAQRAGYLSIADHRALLG